MCVTIHVKHAPVFEVLKGLTNVSGVAIVYIDTPFNYFCGQYFLYKTFEFSVISGPLHTRAKSCDHEIVRAQ